MARWAVLYLVLANVLVFFWYSTQYNAQRVVNKEQQALPGEQKIVLLAELPELQRESLKRAQ